MDTTKNLRTLIGENKIDKVFNHLALLSSKEQDLGTSVIILKSQWEEYLKNKRNGLLSGNDERQMHAKIIFGLLDICNQLDKKSGNVISQNDTFGTNLPIINTPSIAVWTGLGLFLLILTILLAIPCPTPPQFFAFRLGLALAAGTLGTIIPGLLNVNFKMATVGSTLALALLVYLVNPATIIKSNACDKLPFEFTVSLQSERTGSIPKNYPKLEEANLQIRLANKWENVEVDKNGDADFKNIPGDYKNQKVAARLNARYWKLVSDSITLKDKSQVLLVEPDGSLSKIGGKIMDAITGNPITGATIESLGITTVSNETGNFELFVPLDKQRIEYEIYVQKQGYTAAKGNATPATGVNIGILLSR